MTTQGSNAAKAPEKGTKKGETKSWKHGEKSVDKNKKHMKHWEIVKTCSPLLARHCQRWTQKRFFFPDALFLHVPWDLSTFSAEGPIPNAPKCVF